MSYHLPNSITFSEPHYARLVWIHPRPETPVYILPDFVKKSVIDNERLPFLACSSSSAQATWIPLANNEFLPAVGTIKVVTYNKARLGPNTSFTLIVEIAPLSWIHGAQR